MNIVLIGYRCSGKTAVGKFIAAELGKNLVDTDTLIEKEAGCSIETMISSKGWNYFRKIEKRLIAEVSEKKNLVIATGGGAVIDEENVKNLKRNSWIVWLDGKPEVLKERMERDRESGKTRPSLSGTDSLEEIVQVLSERKNLYQRACDYVVDTNRRLPEEVADTIIQALPANIRT
jgi:shikimate kinase